MIMSKTAAKPLCEKALKKLVNYAGGQTHLARMLSYGDAEFTNAMVHNWLVRGCISKRGVIAVYGHKELRALFSPTQLRPDIGEDQWKKLIKDYKSL